jgi:two-component system sensor histidine kinase CpxA
MRRPISLSTKILLLAFLNLFLLVVVFLAFAKVQFRMNLGSFVLAPVQDRILSVSRLIALDFPEHRPETWTSLLHRYSSTYPARFYLFSSDGSQLAGETISLPPSLAEWVKNDHNPFFEGQRSRGTKRDEAANREPPRPPFYLLRQGIPAVYWVGTHIPIRNSSLQHPMHGSLIWVFPSLWTNSFFFDYKPYVVAIGAVILISIACWLPLIRGLSRSIYELTQATRRIAEGQFDIQLPHKRRDELGQLANSIQSMAARLSGFVHGQRRFLGDIAHELCSPIARVQLALGILEQRAQSNQREYVSDLQDEVQHMSDLVNELLSFSKTQINASGRELERVNVAEMARRVVQREAGGFSVTSAIDEDMDVIAYPDYLFRALANVLRNAVRYAGDAGPITISAKRDARHVSISVADEGPGLPPSELDQIFKPFYRPELARQRDTGGVGLGLAIVKSSIEACGGVVQCRNRSPRGLEVEIRLMTADADRGDRTVVPEPPSAKAVS